MKSFYELLTEKLEEPVSQAQPQTPLNRDKDYLMSQLLGRVQRSKPSQNQKRSSYSTIAPKTPEPPALPIIEVWPSDTPTSVLAAVQFFEKNGERILPKTSTLKLKKYFWKLAKKLHPDSGQSQSSHFIQLKLHYDCLLTFLNKK